MPILIVSALVVGLTLGLLGAGGSAITVPVLVYLLGHGVKESIAESMAIVGLISFVAAMPYARAHEIDWRSVWSFGIPGIVGTLIGAWLGGIASEAVQLVVLGCVLLLAALMMIRDSGRMEAPCDAEITYRSPLGKIAIDGTLVGIVTGFVGVGGGFLIVPALVVLGKLPMRLAIGTSLVIIAIKAAVGYAKYEHYLLTHDLAASGQTIMIFSTVGIIGSQFGRQINTRMNQYRLRQVFGGFLILLGCFVVVREASGLLNSKPVGATTIKAAMFAPLVRTTLTESR